jgi:hypothetical protein
MCARLGAAGFTFCSASSIPSYYSPPAGFCEPNSLPPLRSSTRAVQGARTEVTLRLVAQESIRAPHCKPLPLRQFRWVLGQAFKSCLPGKWPPAKIDPQ